MKVQIIHANYGNLRNVELSSLNYGPVRYCNYSQMSTYLVLAIPSCNQSRYKLNKTCRYNIVNLRYLGSYMNKANWMTVNTRGWMASYC